MTIWKTSKKVYDVMLFWYVKVCIFWKCIQYVEINIMYTLRQKVNVKKISFGQNKRYKKCTLFFFRELQLISVLLLICDSYMSWSTSLVFLKLWVGFSIFDSVSFLLKFIFFSTKCMDSLTLKHHTSFQNDNNKKSTHSFAPRRLIFKL